MAGKSCGVVRFHSGFFLVLPAPGPIVQVVQILMKEDQEAKKVPWLSDTHLEQAGHRISHRIMRSEWN